MSLDDWLANGLLVEHRTSPQEIADLFAIIVKRDLRECQTGTHSPEWQLGIVYNAVLQAARAALAVGGYRVPQREGHHYYVLQSLAYTIELDTDTVRHLMPYARSTILAITFAPARCRNGKPKTLSRL